MAWGIISDIHGNLQALEAVLGEMGEVEGIACLGDVVGYGAEPEECSQRIRALAPLVLLKGNHEAGVLGELPLSWFSLPALLALVWTRTVLSEEALDFLSTFSLRATMPFSHLPAAAMEVLFLHGSLSEPFDYVDSAGKADEIFRQTEATLCFLGHTHIAGWFELPDDDVGAEPVSALGQGQKRRRRRFGSITRMAAGSGCCRWTPCPEGGVLRLEKGKRYVINCGSVGQPRDGNPKAAFGIFDPTNGTVDLRRVGYDVEGAQESIRRAGLPEVLAERLAYGL